jgi:hypothetical protein
MDKRGNIIPAANKPRSQWEDYLQRRQFGDEGIPTHTDANGSFFFCRWTNLLGNVIFSKREAKTNPEPIVYMPRDGTNLEDPVKMDRFGMIHYITSVLTLGRIIKA